MGNFVSNRIFKRLALSLVISTGGTVAAYAGGCDIANSLDPAKLVPPAIVGSGPFGEKPSSADSVKLTEEQAAKAKAAKFKVGVVMQTMDIDWSKLVVAGITDTLKKYNAELVDELRIRPPERTDIECDGPPEHSPVVH